jgi:hypothetical protein
MQCVVILGQLKESKLIQLRRLYIPFRIKFHANPANHCGVRTHGRSITVSRVTRQLSTIPLPKYTRKPASQTV